MSVKSMISQLKEQINEANKMGAKYASLSKEKYLEAGQLSKVLDQMEGLPDAVKGVTPKIYKDGVHHKTGAAKAKLLGLLKKHDGKLLCAKLVTEYAMSYNTQYSMMEKFPKTFKMTEVNGHETMFLLEEPPLSARAAAGEIHASA